MLWKKQGNIEWLEFDLLQGHPLRHGVFLRHGGHSKEAFESLNVSYDVGDKEEYVTQNIDQVKDILGVSKLTWAKQCHGKDISLINQYSPNEIHNCDALSTSTPGMALMIKHADCQAAIFYDPVQKVVSVVHSGWKGSVQNIYAHTVEFMKLNYNSKPENLLVCISPSLGPEDSEFINYKIELPKSFWKYQFKPDYFDFWAISEDQLKKAGVLANHIEIMRMSTRANEKDCFSFRRNKVTGRHGTVACLSA
jgi:polyphenol oxidase